jgi:DNA-binding IclR family transcriptional regulator
MLSAVRHAMEIFEALADEPAGLSVTELSARAALNKGSIARVLITLERGEYVVQDPATERYHLSLRTISLANRHMDRLGFPALIQPVVNELAATTGELAQLSAAGGDRLYVIAKAEGDNPIRVESLLGRAIALHASATGKAWLAAQPAARARKILAGLSFEKLGPRTVTAADVLERQLREARSRGFATQREELMEQMSAIAVPVFRGSRREAVGGLAVAAPTFRLPAGRMSKVLPALRRAAERIGAAWPMAAVVRQSRGAGGS